MPLIKKLVLGSFVAAAVASLVKLVGAKRVQPKISAEPETKPEAKPEATKPAYAPNPRSHQAAAEPTHKHQTRKQRKRAARHRQHAT